MITNRHDFRRPYAPPASPDEVPEGGDYDDLPGDMELDFNRPETHWMDVQE